LHHDLKSSNLLVDDKWTVKVCDFGNSRFCQANPSRTSSASSIRSSSDALVQDAATGRAPRRGHSPSNSTKKPPRTESRPIPVTPSKSNAVLDALTTPQRLSRSSPAGGFNSSPLRVSNVVLVRSFCLLPSDFPTTCLHHARSLTWLVSIPRRTARMAKATDHRPPTTHMWNPVQSLGQLDFLCRRTKEPLLI